MQKKRLSKYVIGLDPGLSGSVVILKNGRILETHVMPRIGSEVDSRALLRIVGRFTKHKDKTHLLFEHITPLHKAGKKQNWSLARQVGQIDMMVNALGIPYTEVRPKEWQKTIWKGTRIQYKKVKGKTVTDTKATTRLTVKRLWPNDEKAFLATARSYVPHDGICDAACIAMYGVRKNL